MHFIFELLLYYRSICSDQSNAMNQREGYWYSNQPDSSRGQCVYVQLDANAHYKYSWTYGSCYESMPFVCEMYGCLSGTYSMHLRIKSLCHILLFFSDGTDEAFNFCHIFPDKRNFIIVNIIIIIVIIIVIIITIIIVIGIAVIIIIVFIIIITIIIIIITIVAAVIVIIVLVIVVITFVVLLIIITIMIIITIIIIIKFYVQ